jgi:isopenicillin N synthase-like dioxygenase
MSTVSKCPGSKETIPLVDLGPYLAGEPGALEATAAELRRICETVGFLVISNHGVDAGLMRDTFAAAERFHAQSLEAKMAVALDDRMQGYMPYKSSVVRANALIETRKPNENEAFLILAERDPQRPANRWPEALPEFANTTMRYFAALENLAQRMLPLYARALELPAGYFDPLCNEPYCVLRLTHYPPVTYGPDEYGLAPHTDSTFITLLAQNPVPGLQILTQAGDWIDAPVISDTFIVNTGNILKQWTNGRFISTPHRASNQEPRSRFSIPFFFHPNEDTLIEPLTNCLSATNPPRFPKQTVGEYMAAFRSSNYDHFRGKSA